MQRQPIRQFLPALRLQAFVLIFAALRAQAKGLRTQRHEYSLQFLGAGIARFIGIKSQR
jgi:hypothetical protein